MEFEENIQHWADRYTEAYERKLDYQWYYVLALRYGALSAVEFEGRATDSSRKVEGAPSKGRGARPGSLYLGRCEKGANGVQKRWRLYWPVKKARMYRASCLFQTLYRKYRMLGKWGPVIRFRVKYGRRKVLRAHFRGYRDGVARQKRVQQLIDRHLKGWEDKCLYAWIRFTKKTKEDREQLAVSFAPLDDGGRLAAGRCDGAALRPRGPRLLSRHRRHVSLHALRDRDPRGLAVHHVELA